MKNFLRKLSIVGDSDDQVDAGMIIEGSGKERSFHEGMRLRGGSSSLVVPSAISREPSLDGLVTSSGSWGSPSSPSTSPALLESKPSGLSTLWNAVKDRVSPTDKSTSNLTRTGSGQLRHRFDSSSSGANSPGTKHTVITPPGSYKRPSTPDSVKPGSLLGSENQIVLKCLESEELHRVQTAIALSVLGDNHNTTAGVDENAQIEAAKSLSSAIDSSAVDSSESDAISYRYWARNTVGYDEVITNGFYDLFGVGSNYHVVQRMPALFELQKLPVSDFLNIEVILVDRKQDPELVALEEQAAELAARAGMEVASLARKIAALVAERMGGPVISETDMLLRWQKASWGDKNASQNVVLSLGSLRIGLTRHRALLFKVLADHVGIPCQLLKGRHYPGVEEEGAVNLIKVDHNRELIIDLMGAPGALLPSDSIATNSFETDVSNSPSGSPRAIQSDMGNHSKDMKDPRHQIGMMPYAKLVLSRHNSEPVEYQGPDMNNARMVLSKSMSNFRFPSWTEGIDLPGGRQTNEKDVPQLAVAVLATFAVGRRRVDGEESSIVHPSHQPGSGQREVTVEEIQEEATVHVPRHSDGRKSEPDGNAGDGLDGEVRFEEEGPSENVSGSQQKGSDAVPDDVAEWEIPWEDIVIGERIGLGSYGEVFRGDWHGSDVAVKKFLVQDLSGYALEEFRSEVGIMRRLRHPNVVLFMGAITRPPHLAIVAEFLPRGSLYRLIHRPNYQLDERRRIWMALDVAKGMNYLHSGNPMIVHRDLKSPNLIVDKNWVVKVCDFGLSRMKHNTFLSSKAGAGTGTTEWMAPEMLRNEPHNEKCDVYSFGVILWELATLQQPWAGLNPMQVLGAVGFQYRRLAIPPEMDPSLARIIKDCWHDNPNLRPSFAQLMVALKPLQRQISTAQQSENRQSPTPQGSTMQSRPEEQLPEGPIA